MKEHAVVFAAQSLVGVLTDASIDASLRQPAVVFLNAGVLHRVGPNRVYVRIARELAARGFTSLRFDRSGIGDSLSRRDGLSLRTAALGDVRDALDFMARERGASSFVLVGLCSGADLAFSAALADDRVVGAILLDGLPYQSARSRLHHLVARIMLSAAWRRLFARDGPIWRRLRRAQQPPRAAGAFRPRDVPSRDEAESGLRELTGRGMRLLLVYTRGREYSYPRQFEDMFPSVRRECVDIAYLRNADHTYTLRADQDLLVRTVNTWISRFR